MERLRSYAFQPFPEGISRESLCARLAFVFDADFIADSDLNAALKRRAYLKSFRRRPCFRHRRRVILFRAALLFILSLITLFAALSLRLTIYWLMLPAFLIAAIYGLAHLALLPGSGRYFLRPGIAETHGSKRLCLLLSQRAFHLITDKGMESFSCADLAEFAEDDDGFYLFFRGFSRCFPVAKLAFLKGEVPAFRERLKQLTTEGGAERITQAAAMSLSVAEASPEAGVDGEIKSVWQEIDLGREQLRMLQRRDGFRSGEDAVCLAHRAAQEAERLFGDTPLRFMDLGCGAGMIGLLLSSLLPESKGILCDILRRQAEIADYNIRRNQLQSRLTACCADVRRFRESPEQETISEAALLERILLRGELPGDRMEPSLPGAEMALHSADSALDELSSRRGEFDLLVCNPPYRRRTEGRMQVRKLADFERRVARFDDYMTAEDLAAASDYFLSQNGLAVFIYPLRRAGELRQAMNNTGFVLNRRRSIRSRRLLRAELALFTFVRAGSALDSGHCVEEAALVVREEDGNFSDEVGRYYK